MAHDALVEHCLELLAPAARGGRGGVRAKRMFGGHGLYVDELFIALIVFDKLFLKANTLTQPQYQAAGGEPFVYDAKGKQVAVNYWTVPAEAMDSPQAMLPWARLAMQAALAARAPRKGTPALKPRATKRPA
jgi:DNA transformation protein and related proteins